MRYTHYTRFENDQDDVLCYILSKKGEGLKAEGEKVVPSGRAGDYFSVERFFKFKGKLFDVEQSIKEERRLTAEGIFENNC